MAVFKGRFQYIFLKENPVELLMQKRLTVTVREEKIRMEHEKTHLVVVKERKEERVVGQPIRYEC